MKKTGILILVAIMLLSVLTACNDEGKISGTSEISGSEQVSDDQSAVISEDAESQAAGSSEGSTSSQEEISDDVSSVSSAAQSSKASAVSSQAASSVAGSSAQSSASSSQTSQAQSQVEDKIIVNSLNAAKMDAIKKETNILRWDIPWAPTPCDEFFDFYENASPAVAIWRGIKNEESVFENGDWCVVMHALEEAEDDAPALLMYNKIDIPSNATELQVIARSNPLSDLLSGRGAFRIKVAYKENGLYKVENLKVTFTENQIAQSSADFKQGTDGYVTFENPPKSDKSDAFQFDISKLLGKKDVVFFVEANDRMDTLGEGGVNLPDRVLIAAIRFLFE